MSILSKNLGPRRTVAMAAVATAAGLTDLIASGYASFLPLTVFQAAAAIRGGEIPIDVALVQTSPPDETA